MRYNRGMFREDYVRRMVEQAVTAVTTVLGLTKLERYRPTTKVGVGARSFSRFSIKRTCIRSLR